MFAKTAYIGLIGIVAFCTGCTMCCHPYDYCGPVYENPDNCCADMRSGSILSGSTGNYSETVGDQDVIESDQIVQQRQTPSAGKYKLQAQHEGQIASRVQKQSQPAGEYEGSTQILSVTDRKVDDQDQSVAANTQPAENQPSTSRRNWTAYR